MNKSEKELLKQAFLTISNLIFELRFFDVYKDDPSGEDYLNECKQLSDRIEHYVFTTAVEQHAQSTGIELEDDSDYSVSATTAEEDGNND